MQRTVTTAKAICGTLGVSANKSISHRAAILNAIADGEAIIEDFQRGADCLATISCLRRLGATCRGRGETTLVVKGLGSQGLRASSSLLDPPKSAPTMPLLTGLV